MHTVTANTGKPPNFRSSTTRPGKALPLRIGPPWAEVAIMTIVRSVNRERFTASDIVEQFKLHEWVKREPNTVAEFVQEIGPEPDGLGLVCQGDEVLPCRENAVKALESFGFKLHVSPSVDLAFKIRMSVPFANCHEWLICRIYDLPNIEALYELNLQRYDWASHPASSGSNSGPHTGSGDLAWTPRP